MRVLALLVCAAVPLFAEDQTLRLRDADQRIEAVLIPRTDGLRITTEGGSILGETRATTDRVELVDDRGNIVLTVVREQFGAEVRDASGRLLYSLRQEGTEWRVLDSAGTDVARFRPVEGGFEYLDHDRKLLAKIVPRDDRLRYEDASGALKRDLQGSADARPWIWLALDRATVAERAAIATWFLKVAQ